MGSTGIVLKKRTERKTLKKTRSAMDGGLIARLLTTDRADFGRIMERMLKPVLYELSSMLPSWFPLEWIERPPATNAEQSVISLNHLLFLKCCRLANAHAADSALSFVYPFVTCMDDLCCWLMIFRRCDRVYRLSFQVDQIRGVDVASVYVQQQLDKGGGDPEWLCTFANEIGCAGAMRDTILRLQKYYTDGARRKCLDRLLEHLDRYDERVHQLRLAVAMALHPRLGQGSLIANLGVDLLPSCLPRYTSPPLRSWSGVLRWVL
jgi:hypothetical protein